MAVHVRWITGNFEWMNDDKWWIRCRVSHSPKHKISTDRKAHSRVRLRCLNILWRVSLFFVAEGLKRSPATLLMNQTDRWRERKELLDLMDNTLPMLQNGKNWRLHSEFWAQQQVIGNEETGVQWVFASVASVHVNENRFFFSSSTTLTRTEIGCPLPVETVGKSSVGLRETVLESNDQTSDALYRRDWFNSGYVL